MPKPRVAELRPNLRYGYIDGAFFSLMVGCGETYLAAFVLALSMGEVTAGLITSIPMLAGAVMQLVSPIMVRRFRSHRRWVIVSAAIQAASFIPLVAAAIVGHIPTIAVFALAAIYWGSGMATGPAWNTWMSGVVPARLRAHYFARRSRAAQVAVLLGVVGGGIALQFSASHDQALLAFALLFAVAGISRGISAYYLARQTEPIPPDDEQRMVPARELLSRFRHRHDGRLLLYMLAVQTAVQVSGPYFTPFMLGQLKMTYGQYLLLIATAYSARILMLPWLGAMVRRTGSLRVLWFSGLAIIPLSALWLVSPSITWLFFVQLTAGAVWAAYELATLLLLFETIAPEERTSVLTTFNLANATATVAGSAIGGLLLYAMGTDHTAYLTIFALSAVLRAATVLLLIPAVRSIKPGDLPREPIPVPTRIVSVRPEFGDTDRPILPGLPGPSGDETAISATDRRVRSRAS